MARVRQEATCLQRPLRLGDGCCLRYALLLYPGDRSCTLSFGSWGPRHERQHSLCETSHGLTPRTKVRFITMGGRSKLVKAARSVSAAARAASSRRRARAAGASRALPPLDQSRPPTMGALRRKSGGTRFRSNEWGEPRSTRGSSATAAPACWEHVPRTHSHAPHSGRTHKIFNPRAPSHLYAG